MALEAPGPRTVFPCNTCSLSFTSSEAQRSHMRTSWHLHNLQRKMSDLAAISAAEFEEREGKSAVVGRKSGWTASDEVTPCAGGSRRSSGWDEEGQCDERRSSDEERLSEESEQHLVSSQRQLAALTPTATRCLFCPLPSHSTHENLTHMSSTHGFNLDSPLSSTAPAFPAKQSPSQSSSSETNHASTVALEPLLAYLSLVVFTYCECVYCGKQKGSVGGVQSHMRDKRHCRVEWGDYVDFLGNEDGEEEDGVNGGGEAEQGKAKKISGTELLLPSGQIVNSRRHQHHHHGSSGGPRDTNPADSRLKFPSQQQRRRRRAIAIGTSTSASSPQTQTTPPSNCTGLSTAAPPHTSQPLNPNMNTSRSNNALSLAGLSATQLASLATLDKKMRRQQGTARKKVAFAALQQPVKTVYYKTENPVYQAG